MAKSVMKQSWEVNGRRACCQGRWVVGGGGGGLKPDGHLNLNKHGEEQNGCGERDGRRTWDGLFIISSPFPISSLSAMAGCNVNWGCGWSRRCWKWTLALFRAAGVPLCPPPLLIQGAKDRDKEINWIFKMVLIVLYFLFCFLSSNSNSSLFCHQQ